MAFRARKVSGAFEKRAPGYEAIYSCFNLVPIRICIGPWSLHRGHCRFPIRNLFACFLHFYTSFQLQNFVATLTDRNGSSSTGICGHVHVRSNDQRFHHRVSGAGCY